MIYSSVSWYWIVGNRPGLVFSAPASAYVATDDAGYVAFQESGGIPTRIAEDGLLAHVLWQAGLNQAAMSAGITSLGPIGAISGADAVGMLSSLGILFSSTAEPTLGGIYPLDTVSQQKITAEALYIQVAAKFTNGQTTKAWYDMSGSPHTFTTAYFIQFAEAAAAYIDALLSWAPEFVADPTTTPPSNTVVVA
jgi:hypothetical protein